MKNTLKYHDCLWFNIPFFCILLIFLLLTSVSFLAQELDNCEEKLDEARVNFNQGIYNEVINSIRPCLDNFDSLKLEIEGHELVGQSYARLGKMKEARKNARKIIELDSLYSPDQHELFPDFKELVKDEQMKQNTPRSWWQRNKKYIFATGGAILVGGTVCLFVCKGDEKPLPEPPDYPETR